MRLHRIRLINYKGVAEREVEFPDTGVVIISGDNEVGKTSLVEALGMVVGYKHTSGSRVIRVAQPVGRDVGVSVEVEFSLAGHRVVLSRTWLRKPTTTLSFVEGPRAGEKLAGDQANNAFDELWSRNDEVLWRALQLLQVAGSGPWHLGDSRVLSGALDAASGGDDISDDAQQLLTKVSEEVNRYFTPTRKPNKDYQSVLTEVERSASEWRAAEEAVAGLEDARQAVDEAEQRYEQLNLAVAGARREVEVWHQRLAGVTDAVEVARSAGESVRSAGLEAERADTAWRERFRLTEQVDERRQQITDSMSAIREAQQDVDALEQGVAQRRAEYEAEFRRLGELTRSIERVRSRRDHLVKLADKQRLASRLASFEELRQQMALLEAKQIQDCDEAFFTRLEKARVAAAEAQWKLEAASARLGVEVLGSDTILVDGAPISNDLERPVTTNMMIEVPGIVRLTIRAASFEDLRSAAEKADEELAEMLAIIKAPDMDAALRLKAELDNARIEWKILSRQREDLLDGDTEAQLRDRLENLTAQVNSWSGEPSPSDLPDCDAALACLDEERARCADAVDLARIAREAAEAKANFRCRELADLQGRQQILDQELASRVSELNAARQETRDDDLQAAKQRAAANLQVAQERHQVAEAHLVELGADAVQADATSAEDNLKGLTERLREADRRRIEAKSRLAALAPDELQTALDEAATRAEAARDEADSWQLRAERAKLLEETLLVHREQAQARYVEPFRHEIVELGRALHADPGFDVRIDTNLVIAERHLGGCWLGFDALSTGAKEQLVILARLAAACLVAPGEPMPVVLDDALGHADQRRLRRMWNALTVAGDKVQVIVLTANPDRYAGLCGAMYVEL